MVIKPPVTGEGWLVSSGCCKPNIHRDLRIAIDGVRIETAETFAIDWAKVKNGRIFDGDGSKGEQHYAFGEDVLAVADGTVVSIQDGKPETTPNVPMIPERKEDYGGNHVILEIAPNVFALYVHLHPGSLTVKVGEVVKAGAPLAKLGNTGPSMAPTCISVSPTSPTFSPDGACLSSSTASPWSARSISTRRREIEW